jgi:acyl-CoA thioester hydrolase
MQRVIDTKSGEIKCVCRSVMVTYNLEKHESMALTEEWINAICLYEGKDLKRKKRELSL